MTGAIPFRSAARSPAALARLGPSLAASALVHWALLSGLLPDSPWWGVVSYPAAAPITVRLARVPVPVPEGPALPEPEAHRMPLPAKPAAGSTERPPDAHSPSGAARPGAETPAMPPAPDPHYYPARDLDDYPTPLAPLRLNRLAGDGAGEARLEVLIDERGIVRDMTFTAPAAPARVEEALRAALATTRFLPAQKDGRTVRSRIVLSVKMGTHTISEPRIFNEEEGH